MSLGAEAAVSEQAAKVRALKDAGLGNVDEAVAAEVESLLAKKAALQALLDAAAAFAERSACAEDDQQAEPAELEQ
jgi:hypothetical protein